MTPCALAQNIPGCSLFSLCFWSKNLERHTHLSVKVDILPASFQRYSKLGAVGLQLHCFNLAKAAFHVNLGM